MIQYGAWYISSTAKALIFQLVYFCLCGFRFAFRMFAYSLHFGALGLFSIDVVSRFPFLLLNLFPFLSFVPIVFYHSNYLCHLIQRLYKVSRHTYARHYYSYSSPQSYFPHSRIVFHARETELCVFFFSRKILQFTLEIQKNMQTYSDAGFNSIQI